MPETIRALRTCKLARINNGESTPILNIARATTLLERNRGLIGRSSLPPRTGLWIEPCSSIHTLFMTFPIDVVFLRRAGERWSIAKLIEHIAPWTMQRRCLGAHATLEMPIGTIRALHLVQGDLLTLIPA